MISPRCSLFGGEGSGCLPATRVGDVVKGDVAIEMSCNGIALLVSCGCGNVWYTLVWLLSCLGCLSR